MDNDVKLVMWLLCLLVGVNAVVLAIVFNNMGQADKDFESFKTMSCSDQENEIKKYQFSSSRDMTDETRYHMSECVLKDGSYAEYQELINKQNEFFKQALPWMILGFAIPTALVTIGFHYSSKMRTTQQDIIDERNWEESKSIVEKYDAMEDIK